MSKVRNETEVTTDTAEAQKPWEKYYEHVFTNKEDNLTEMDKFLETQSSKTNSWRNRKSE